MFTRQLSNNENENNKAAAADKYECLVCSDIHKEDDISMYLRLGCKCIIHYHCLIMYLQTKIGDRLSMSLKGISCPYGSSCRSFLTLDEVGGDETKIYYITMEDLDNIVDYGISHPNLHQYLDIYSCDDLTHEEVTGLKEWIREQESNKKITIKFTDDDFDLYIKSTTKKCPNCGYRSSHYHGHSCHHISPARPPQRGGCPNCHIHYCYKCLSSEIENKMYRGKESSCTCPQHYWSNFCLPITSQTDIDSYVSYNEGGIPYDTRCGCTICSDCRKGKRCAFCDGNCCVCKGVMKPAPSEVIGTKLQIELWNHCRVGNMSKIVEMIANKLSIDVINISDSAGDNALLIALKSKHAEIVILFISMGVNLNIADKDGKSPLMLSLELQVVDVVKVLLTCKLDVNCTDRFRNTIWAPLVDNLKHIRDMSIVLKIIKFDSFNPKLIDSKGMTPVDHLVSVSYLCIEGTEEALKLMLTHPQFDVSVINNSKFTSRLLSYIYISIGKTMLQSLLKYPDLNISRLCLDGTSILHEVYTRGDKETFNLLLEHPQVDLNIIYKNSTILHEAYSRDDMEAFHLLLSHPQLDLNKTYNNTNILNEVYRRNDMETFSLLLSNPRLNLSVVLEDDTILDQVLKRGDVQTYLMLSKSPTFNPSTASKSGTLLLLAFEIGSVDIINHIISSYDIDPNPSTKDAKGWTLLHLACDRGDLDLVKNLMKLSSLNLNVADCIGDTPLLLAMKRKHYDIVKELMKSSYVDVSISNIFGTSLLHVALKLMDIELFRSTVAHPTFKYCDSIDRFSFLHYLASNDYIELLELLLQHFSTDVNKEHQGQTPLHVATFKAATLLLQHPNINPNKVPSVGMPALHKAVKNSDVAMVKLLLDHKDIAINTLNVHEETALVTGLRVEKIPWDCISILLNHKGMQVDKALFWAIKRYRETNEESKKLYDCIKDLSRKPNIDLNFVQPGGTLPLLWAYTRHKELFQIFIAHPQVDINSKDIDGKSLLQLACDKGDIALVLRLIETPNIDLTIFLSNGRTILHFLIEIGNRAAIDKFLKIIDTDFQRASYCLNKKDQNGTTALVYACEIEDYDTVNKLLSNKTFPTLDPNLSDKDLPIFILYELGQRDLFMKLLSHPKFDINVKDKTKNCTILHLMYDKEDTNTVHQILEAGNINNNRNSNNNDNKLINLNGKVNANISNDAGNTYLHLSVLNEDLVGLRMLLKYPNIKLRIVNSNGQAPLHLALSSDNSQMIELLIEHPKANIHRAIALDTNVTILDEIITNASIDIVKMALKRISCVEAVQGFPLHSAVTANRYDVVKLLLNLGAIDVNRLDDTNGGYSALHLSCLHRNIDMLKLLLTCDRLDINTLDRGGFTSLELAFDKKFYDVADILISNSKTVLASAYDNAPPMYRAKIIFKLDEEDDSYDLEHDSSSDEEEDDDEESDTTILSNFLLSYAGSQVYQSLMSLELEPVSDTYLALLGLTDETMPSAKSALQYNKKRFDAVSNLFLLYCSADFVLVMVSSVSPSSARYVSLIIISIMIMIMISSN